MPPLFSCHPNDRSEVEADGGEEGTGTGCVEIVVRDVRQTEVIAQLGIDEVVLDATADPDTAIEALEALIVVGAVSLTVTEVLDLACYTQGQVASDVWLDTEHTIYVNHVFHHQRHLQIVKAISEFRAIIASLTTFFYIRESCLEIHGRAIGHLEASHRTDIQASLGRAAIEITVVRVHGGESGAKAYA